MATTKSKFNLDAIKAVSERASQKMSSSSEEKKAIKNPKGAGRKPVQEQAKHKISVNLTDSELEIFHQWCSKNGMKPAAALRYCLTKLDAL
jgi:hypothetical protein